jgi:hypothetical protein
MVLNPKLYLVSLGDKSYETDFCVLSLLAVKPQPEKWLSELQACFHLLGGIFLSGSMGGLLFVGGFPYILKFVVGG